MAFSSVEIALEYWEATHPSFLEVRTLPDRLRVRRLTAMIPGESSVVWEHDDRPRRYLFPDGCQIMPCLTCS